MLFGKSKVLVVLNVKTQLKTLYKCTLKIKIVKEIKSKKGKFKNIIFSNLDT